MVARHDLVNRFKGLLIIINILSQQVFLVGKFMSSHPLFYDRKSIVGVGTAYSSGPTSDLSVGSCCTIFSVVFLVPLFVFMTFFRLTCINCSF
jgi:hypothetical protein